MKKENITKIEYSCSNCEASFEIAHEMNPDIYTVMACPFCEEQDSLETEEIYDFYLE